MTINGLRAHLDAMEAAWTAVEKLYAGEFGEQPALVPYITKEGAYAGLVPFQVQNTGMGIVLAGGDGIDC